jgi:hypothetical protein
MPPGLPAGLTYVAIDAGDDHSLALRSDGTLVTFGYNLQGILDVPGLPAGLAYVEAAAGFDHSVVRRSDGSVVAWGLAGAGQTTVPALPQGVSFADVEADWLYSLARRSDGSVVVWGTTPAIRPGHNVPSGSISFTPRMRAMATTIRAPKVERNAAWMSGGMSCSASLTAT